MFLTRAREKGDKPFLWSKRDGALAVDQLESKRRGRSRRWPTACKRIGLKPGDRVMLVSENRPEWLIADLGIMAAGCVTVPTYTTNTTRDHQHILANSGASAVIVSTQKLAKTLIPAVLFASECHHVIGIDDIRTGQSPDVAQFHHWADLVAGAVRRRRARAAHGRGRARGPRLHHLHQRHRRRAARRDAAPRHDPPQCRGLHRHHRQRLRLGRRDLPVVPARQPRL